MPKHYHRYIDTAPGANPGARMEASMKEFPWFWQQAGDAWEAMLGRGGPDEGRRHGPRHDRERERAGFGPGGPGEPPEPPPPGWGPGGRGRGGNPFGGNPFGGNPFGGNPFGFGGPGPG